MEARRGAAFKSVSTGVTIIQSFPLREEKCGNTVDMKRLANNKKERKKTGGGQGSCDLSAPDERGKKSQIIQHSWDSARKFYYE